VTRWIVEKGEDNQVGDKVITYDSESAVVLGLCRKAHKVGACQQGCQMVYFQTKKSQFG
jgi:hypothetical protein